MNPDTKLSTEQLLQICKRHNIKYHSHSRITTGFSHEIHLLNRTLIVKLFNTTKSRNFNTELVLLQSDLDFPKPKLIASYQGSGDQDRSYIIMSFVTGYSLGTKWHEASDNQREQLIKSISKSLKTINDIKPQAIGDISVDWGKFIEDRIKNLADKLLTKNILNNQQVDQIIAKINTNKKYLAGSKLFPVYWDIHFDNFIVNKQFELQAVVDLENVELTPLDYPLFVVQKLTDEPQKYLSEDYEKYANTKDYANLKYWYKKYYPQIFAFDNLNERVNLYLLVDTLHLLLDWPNVKELYKKLEILTQK